MVKSGTAIDSYLIGIITAIFVLLSFAYSLVTPIFEAPDESAHYRYADFVARTGQLPTLDYAHPADEYHQPPLYYWLNSVWVSFSGWPDDEPFLKPNPMAAISDTASFGNKNAFRHNFAAEAWPWHGIVLALHLARFTSIVMGAATVWTAYWIGRIVFDDRRWLAASVAGVVAFNPQFVFISASMNNDNLVTMLVTFCLWLALRYIGIRKSETSSKGIKTPRHQGTKAPRQNSSWYSDVLASWRSGSLTWRQSLIAGMLVGLAILAKPTGWIAGVGLGFVFLVQVIQGRFRREIKLHAHSTRHQPQTSVNEGDTPSLSVSTQIINVVIFASMPLLLAGWWLYRNQILYQDLLLQRYMMAYLGVDAVMPVTLAQFIQRLREAEVSFWATFGWLNITTPDMVYTIYRGLTRIALLGVAVGAVRAVMGRMPAWGTIAQNMVIPTLTLAAMGGTIWQWVALAGGIQGRLLFPVIVPLALVVIWGLYGLVGQQLTILWPLYSLSVALYALIFVLRPAYMPPPTLAELPDEAQPVEVRFAENIVLAGYALPPQALTPGQPFDITLYWLAEAPIIEPYAVFVHAVDEAGLVIAQTQGYAGHGLLSADQWPMGAYIVDRAQVQMPGLTMAPTTGVFSVGLYNPETGERVSLADGASMAQIGRFSIQPIVGFYDVSWSVAFEEGITLLGFDGAGLVYRPGDNINITLHWQTDTSRDENYTVFMHVLDEAGIRVAQHDGWPVDGNAPTSIWPLNQPIADTHTVQLPIDLSPGIYRIWVGLYDSESGRRVRLRADEGLFGADALRLGQFVVRH